MCRLEPGEGIIIRVVVELTGYNSCDRAVWERKGRGIGDADREYAAMVAV